jgi:hypothetical protein
MSSHVFSPRALVVGTAVMLHNPRAGEDAEAAESREKKSHRATEPQRHRDTEIKISQ